jgi:hypothetical protein
MLEIKSTPPHNYDVDIKLLEEVDFEEFLGRIDKDGNLVEKELEVIIDGKKALVKLIDHFKEPWKKLPLLNCYLLGVKGFNGKDLQKMLVKKYGNKVKPDTEIIIYTYKLIELGE